MKDIHWKVYENEELVAMGKWIYQGYRFIKEETPALDVHSGFTIKTNNEGWKLLIWDVITEPEIQDFNEIIEEELKKEKAPESNKTLNVKVEGTPR